MCQCLIFLEEPLEVANILEKLSRGSSADALMAYQVCLANFLFDPLFLVDLLSEYIYITLSRLDSIFV